MAITSQMMGAGLSSGAAGAIVGSSRNQVGLGTTQADATQISVANNFFLTVASGTGGRLPIGSHGDDIFVTNLGANNLLIYPPEGGQISMGGVNTPVTVEPQAGVQFKCYGVPGTSYAIIAGDTTIENSSANVFDDGVLVVSAPTELNFTGDVVVTDAGGGRVDIDVTGGTGAPDIYDEAVLVVTAPTKLNFTGDVTVTDAGGGQADIDITGGSVTFPLVGADGSLLDLTSGVQLDAETGNVAIRTIDATGTVYLQSKLDATGRSTIQASPSGENGIISTSTLQEVARVSTQVLSTTDGKVVVTAKGTTGFVELNANNGTGVVKVVDGRVEITGHFKVEGVTSTGATGTGLLVFNNAPTFIAPVLGTPASGNLTNCTGYDTSDLAGLGANVATWLATPSSANLISAVTDETGTGALVFANTPTLVTPVLGVATATSVNKVAITAPATSATLTIADGKTLTASNSITLAGTDSTTMTFPPASANIGYLEIPVNTQAGNYSTVLADSGKSIYHASGAGAGDTYTIDGSVSYPVGAAITFTNLDSNALSIAISTDTMNLAGAGTAGTRTLAQYGIATAYKYASGLWLISGTGLT